MSRSLRVRMRRWHRSLGAVIALGAVFLVITGISLNHASDWQLDQPGVASNWIVQHYGIHIAPPQSGWHTSAGWFSHCADQLWRNQQHLAAATSLVGVAQHDGLLFVASRDSLLLLDAQGNRIDRLGLAELPGRLQAITATAEGIAVQTPRGWLASNSDLLQWSALAAAPTAQPAQALPADLAQAVAQAAGRHELSWERVLQDLHSGRFFGHWGPYVIDALAIGLALLALSGLWLWFKSRPRHY